MDTAPKGGASMIASARQRWRARWRRWRLEAVTRRTVVRLELALRMPHKLTTAKSHNVPEGLIVSLTSYPPRFSTLHLTLAALLMQSVRPDKVVLWIAEEDLELLPSRVRRLTKRGLEIRSCEDIRSYKKLIYSLSAFPNAYIATADDDVYYPKDWLATLLGGCRDDVRSIICHRARRLKRSADGRIASYSEWENDVQDARARAASTDLVPIGIGGVLYPPHCFSHEVGDRGLFERLSPDGDDLWFFWMARRKGTRHKKVGGRFQAITWAGSQQTRLFEGNSAGGNDLQIRALETEFGMLPSSS